MIGKIPAMDRSASPAFPPVWLRPIPLIRSTLGRILLGIGIAPFALNAGAGLPAEQITLTYGAAERSIAIFSLEAYANNGEVPRELRAYTRYLGEEQLQQLRQVLTARANLSPVTVSQFLYTDQGEALLRQFGEIVRTESNLSGFYALRSALILAAADPKGLTLLNVLQKFPFDSVRIDLGRGLNMLSNLEELIRQTQSAVALVAEQSETEASLGTWLDFNNLPDLRLSGRLQWQKHSIVLDDKHRNRTFLADIYLPVTSSEAPVLNAPLVVISHGLGSDRSTYAYVAQHLASYGFAVAVPEHPGSNSAQLQALIMGSTSQVIEPNEFINRPLDIQYLLDELAVLAQTDSAFKSRFDLERVGVIGQSMGGYTALALAGAQINISQLQTDCTDNTFNLSLLLQCRALNLVQPLPNFRDPRVKAVLAISPIGSSLLGRTDYGNIDIPVMVMSGSSDTVAPALPEQIEPFTWLQTPNRYLVMLRGGTHFSTIDVPNVNAASEGELVQLPTEIVGPDPAIAHSYLKSLSLAFFGTYVANDLNYQPYLESAYTKAISEEAMPLSLLQSLTSTQLAKAIDLKTRNGLPVETNVSVRVD